MKRLTSIAAAVFTAAFLAAATSASAQDSNINQRTILTFSGPVQMPGVTLPGGKYVFRLANTALLVLNLAALTSWLWFPPFSARGISVIGLLLAADAVALFLVGAFVLYWAEQSGNPTMAKLGVDSAYTGAQSGGNMEGKEVRFGIGQSVLTAVTTSNTSTPTPTRSSPAGEAPNERSAVVMVWPLVFASSIALYVCSYWSITA
jgi:hypothetical protein